MAARKVIVAGGSGFLGHALVEALRATGYEPTVLTRRGGNGSVQWDARTVGPWAQELEGAEAVINLAGEPIAQKWTPEARERILRSRVESCAAICQAIRRAQEPPHRWLNASAIGFYGNSGSEPLDEDSNPGDDFLGRTCLAWEKAVETCAVDDIFRTRVRIGLVLGREGGLLPTLGKLAKVGLGGTVGKGTQYMSWIHLDDLIGIFLWLLAHPAPPSVVNGTAPQPVTNREFMKQLRSAAGMPVGLPAPAFGVELVGRLFGPDSDLVLNGANVRPTALVDAGFQFRHPQLAGALEDLMG